MMSFVDTSTIEEQTKRVNIALNAIPYLIEIKSDDHYEKALDLMDVVIDDYEENRALVEVLSMSIARWEDTAPEFEEFNESIKNLDAGLAMLAVIKDQHGLTNADFKDEIGNKSMVSMIFSGTRKLSLDHMKNLSARFNIPVRSFV